MKKINLLVLFVMFAWACNSSDSNESNESIDTLALLEDSNITLLDENNDSTDEPVRIEGCDGEVLLEMGTFLSKHLEPEYIKEICKQLHIYENIKTDSALADFYANTAYKIVECLDTTMRKHGYEENLEDELTAIWNNEVGDYIPFVTIIMDNTFDGPSAYLAYNELLEKAKTTEGTADDYFFKVLVDSHGDYYSSYNYKFNDYDANYMHSKLGEGEHLATIKKTIELDSLTTAMFRNQLGSIINYVLSAGDVNVFGYSKREVLNELAGIAKLQNSTNYDLSMASNLKAKIDTVSEGFYFDCVKNECWNTLNR